MYGWKTVGNFAHTRRKTRFGGSDARGIRLAHAYVSFIIVNGVSDGDEHADHHAQEWKPTDTRGPASRLLVHDGERGEEHVQRAVDDGHVDGQQEHDGLAEEQDPRAQEGRPEGVADADFTLLGIHPTDVHFPRDFRELLCALAQENGRVRLW